MPTRTELTSDELNFLRSVFPGELLLSPEELLVYRSDASLIQGTPLACVCPENTDQVQKLMVWADEVRMPIYIRGRGTNLVGDCVAVQPGIIVSTSKMDHILEINNRDFVGIVEPGVNTARFQAACEAKGVYYPPDPATVKASSLGGNVVTCAGGMRAVKYGVTRDFVLGTEVILPGGEKVMFGGRAHKNVVGLDLAKLMVGSEGTLGFISKIFLKLLPKPESSATVMAGFASYKDALEAVGGIFGAGILPCALEFIGERIVKLMNKDGDIPWPADKVNSVLLIRLDGSRETLPIEINQVAHNLPSAVWTLKGVGPEQKSLSGKSADASIPQSSSWRLTKCPMTPSCPAAGSWKPSRNSNASAVNTTSSWWTTATSAMATCTSTCSTIPTIRKKPSAPGTLSRKSARSPSLSEDPSPASTASASSRTCRCSLTQRPASSCAASRPSSIRMAS